MTDYSSGDRIEVPCENCGTVNSCQVWVVVDAHSTPALLDAAVNGIINRYVCRRCSHEGVADTPIVIYGALATHPVIISPAGPTLGDAQGAVAYYFVQELGERLGDPGLLDRVAMRLPIIPRAVLGSALRPPPQAQPSPKLMDMVADLVSARTWDVIADLMTRYPELSSEETERLLDRMAGRLRGEGRAADAELWERRRDFVHVVRTFGLAQAIKDVTGLTLDQVRRR